MSRTPEQAKAELEQAVAVINKFIENPEAFLSSQEDVKVLAAAKSGSGPTVKSGCGCGCVMGVKVEMEL